MAVSDEFLTYVLDQLSGMGEVSFRRMFGGAGVYLRGLMFGLVAEDVLYFRADEANRGDYEAQGCGPFKPFEDRREVMPYYEVPIDVLEDREAAARWGEKALAAAQRGKKKKKGSGKKKG